MKVGIVALGSHQERHGAALPLDTDARIAEYMAEKVSERTGSEFLGTLKSAYELPGIDTGKHESLDEVAEELKGALRDAKEEGVSGVVLVNAHGGNQELEKRLEEIGEETKVELGMDSTICNLEGPHAGTGELSIGAVLGITDESRIEEHGEVDRYPEVGFVGFEEAREKYEWAEEHAREIIEEGVEIDRSLGRDLLRKSIASAAEKVRELKSRD
ncbi:hypothetical protein AKJ57_05580 [candidate division MSBL1 archaeon SCGC-AAA259A05]|uniref:2-amino-5-formylamino-6-ribosylaminopyrimidin-4(3H)-one 5'-monophosphate deformylase n=1 Tax=candidate division MSBL1 archaeon SCGC-AAA259A05 TaxID=1698259 RepID=A0A133U4Z5_9EURY|nr:hypothetical protein AKJ57_05580 [candidate division MSBL1 archaeon SCGC-AAA259A05]